MTVAAEPSPFTSGDRQGYLLALSNISSRMNLLKRYRQMFYPPQAYLELSIKISQV